MGGGSAPCSEGVRNASFASVSGLRAGGGNGQPIAYGAWARVSDDVHKRLEAGERTLKPEDWNSGPHPWLIDLAAPPQVLPRVLAELQAKVFKGEVVRTLVRRPPQSKGK